MEEADWKGILFSMGMLVLECKTDGSLAVVGDVPQWCDGSELHFGSRGTSAFLDSFLTDAEKFWNEKTGNRFRSGIWIEHEPSGLEYQLEAFALSTAKKRFLIIQPVPPEDRQLLIQKAREKSLDNIRLSRSERSAKRREQRLSKFLDALPDWIFRVKNDGTLLDFKVSKGNEEDGFAQFLGKNITEIFPSEIAAELLQSARQAQRTGEMQTSQFQLSADQNYEFRIVNGDQGEALFILRELAKKK